MDREAAKQLIKDRLEERLQQKGINTRKPFLCLNPAHSDTKPSMSYDPKRQKAHCFACRADYDTFDLIGIEEGLTDYNAIFLKACELYGITPDRARRTTAAEDFTVYQNQHKTEQNTQQDIHTSTYTQQQEQEADYTAFFAECRTHIAETTYPQSRGLKADVVERFGLGYCSNFYAGYNTYWKGALIIPTGKGSYVARNTAPDAAKENRYRKKGKMQILNAEALKTAQKPIFVAEGELDAMAIISVGGEAVGLGSTSNVKAFARLTETIKPTQPLIIALDNDTEGVKAAEELAELLAKQGLPFYRVNPYGDAKDAGEALLTDTEAFTNAIKKAERIKAEAEEAEREAYLKTNNAEHLQSFINGIADSVDTPCIATGFSKLDSVLDGGLYEGLYIIGAISSLGKTTLITQMADQIAAAGTDVLIFSLEMSREEIMSKSISRHTLIKAMAEKIDLKNAKTARGITTGKRYINYSKVERELINAAIADYSQYAGRIFVSVGVGDIGVEQIRQTVENHIRYTGRKPVVVVDYLQIVAPYSERATDKQNTDKTVLELKRISRDCKIPVFAISSFNRANYSEKVSMEAFKESGAVEYSSDVLIGLQLSGAGTKNFDATAEKKKDPRTIELVILKNRNGRVGDKVTFAYYPLFNYFAEE